MILALYSPTVLLLVRQVKLMIKGPDNNTEASILTAPHWTGPCELVGSASVATDLSTYMYMYADRDTLIYYMGWQP